MVIAAAANSSPINPNWATIIPLFVDLMFILIPAIVAYVGVAVKNYLDAHTTGKTQDVLEKIAATAVQAVEQMFAREGSTEATQKAKFDAAASLLFKTATQQVGVTLSDDQIKGLIESAVHALNAGAVALVPGAAPLLPAEVGVSNNVNLDQFKQDVMDTVTQAVPSVVQSTLAGMLGAVVSGTPQPAQPQGQQTVGQVSSSPQPDVVVQPGVSVGLAGTAPAASTTGTLQPPVQS